MEFSNKNAASASGTTETVASGGNRPGRITAGLIVVAVGIILLARAAGVYLPHWIFSWEMLMIAIGLFIGFRHSFRNIIWLVFVLIGTVFLIDDIFPYLEISDYAWPLIIIGIGLFMIFRSGKKNDWRTYQPMNTYEQNFADDALDSVVIFGGVKKNVISKNFRGGEAVTVFGGTDINLMQADINGTVVLDLTQIFGGTKLIVPPHWKIQSDELVAIFGGLEDKRPQMSDPSTQDSGKTLVIRGTCLFGGIDIKSY